jgi:hypothetical protein
MLRGAGVQAVRVAGTLAQNEKKAYFFSALSFAARLEQWFEAPCKKIEDGMEEIDAQRFSNRDRRACGGRGFADVRRAGFANGDA